MKKIVFASCVCCSLLFLYVLDLEGLLLVVQRVLSGCCKPFPPRDFLLRSFVLIFVTGSWIRVGFLVLATTKISLFPLVAQGPKPESV
jgi:hypothetical protein